MYSVIVVSCLLAACNAFDDRRPAQDELPNRLQNRLDELQKDPNSEVQFVDVQADDGEYEESNLSIDEGIKHALA